MKRRAIIGLAPITLLAACGDGSSLDNEVAAKAPTTAVTIHLSPPPECREALDKADELLAIAVAAIDKGTEAIGLAGETVGAVVDFDVAAMEALVPEIEAIGQWFRDETPAATAARAAYDTAKAACLEA